MNHDEKNNKSNKNCLFSKKVSITITAKSKYECVCVCKCKKEKLTHTHKKIKYIQSFFVTSASHLRYTEDLIYGNINKNVLRYRRTHQINGIMRDNGKNEKGTNII